MKMPGVFRALLIKTLEIVITLFQYIMIHIKKIIYFKILITFYMNNNIENKEK